MIEEWKPVIGHEGRYEVSNMGRIKSLSKLRGRSVRPDKILTPMVTKKGYHRIELADGKSGATGRMIHSLVCEAFNGARPSPAHIVNHIDAVKTNNVPKNLEWVTAKQNAEHAKNMGLLHAYKGQDHPNSKLTSKQALQIRTLCAKGKNQDDIAAKFGVSQALVNAIHLRTAWKHL